MESSRGDDSNGCGITPLGLVIVEISRKPCFSAVKKICFIAFVSPPTDRGGAGHGSLESSRGDGSISGGFASPRSIDVEISDEMLIAAVKGWNFSIFSRIKVFLKDFYGKW